MPSAHKPAIRIIWATSISTATASSTASTSASSARDSARCCREGPVGDAATGVEMDSSKTGGTVRNQFGLKSKQKLKQLIFWVLAGGIRRGGSPRAGGH